MMIISLLINIVVLVGAQFRIFSKLKQPSNPLKDHFILINKMFYFVIATSIVFLVLISLIIWELRAVLWN